MQSPIITVVYSHGRNSSPWHGYKIEVLRPIILTMGMNIVSVRYTENMSIVEMEEHLFNIVKDDINVPNDLVFLSSSRGAYISTHIAQKVIDFYNNESLKYDKPQSGNILPPRNVIGQFLIAPAFYVQPNYYPDQSIKTTENLTTTIIHGFEDEIVSFENSIKFAKQCKSELYLIKGDHRLIAQRDKLCVLFENFLQDCKKKSNKIFEKWLIQNKKGNS